MIEHQGKHILVIRLSAMGDVAMAVPVLLAFQKQYPNFRLTVLTKPFFAPIFSHMENVQVHTADVKGRHKGIIGLWRLYTELRVLGFDAVADMHNVLRSAILKQFFRLGGIPFFQIDKGRPEKKALTAADNKAFKPLKTTHQRYADVFAKVGYPIMLSEDCTLTRQPISDSTRRLVGKDIVKWIGIAPFAAYEGKQYPLELMNRVIEGIHGMGDHKILLFGGGKKEKEVLEQLASENQCINITGKLHFSEELALISNLDVMIAMDSGNAHLAAMFGIPVVTLWGVTHPFAGFYPFGQDPALALLADRERFPLIPTSIYGNKVPDGYETAIASIAPADVVEKIKMVLSAK